MVLVDLFCEIKSVTPLTTVTRQTQRHTSPLDHADVTVRTHPLTHSHAHLLFFQPSTWSTCVGIRFDFLSQTYLRAPRLLKTSDCGSQYRINTRARGRRPTRTRSVWAKALLLHTLWVCGAALHCLCCSREVKACTRCGTSMRFFSLLL